MLVLADVHRDRGEVEQAGAAALEVAALAEKAGDRQALVQALVTAALVAADPTKAATLADRAVTADPRWPEARLARAWTALHAGETVTAGEDARWVQEAARRSGQPMAQAGAHELLAVLAPDPDTAQAELAAAAELWARSGCRLDVLRVQHAAARLAGDAATADAWQADRAAAGVRGRVVEVAGLDRAVAHRQAAMPGSPGVVVQVFTLGGFALHRDGVAISTAEWGSRKPRELLQVLLSRRGQRVPRGVLTQTLWPEETGNRVANRLSGAISVLRGVLDPDKVHPSDHFVVADPAAVWLDRTHLDIDLVRFHEAVTAARAALAADEEGAEAVMERAVALYAGEFLADVPYDDWTTSAREEARAVHMGALRTLFGLAITRGDHDAAIRWALRLLTEDPYDEDAYRQLIGVCSAAGRHGEAQRHYRTYVAQMRRLDVTPMPFPGVSGLSDLV
jgi:DNA-binding SARP family transcriptional activator